MTRRASVRIPSRPVKGMGEVARDVVSRETSAVGLIPDDANFANFGGHA